MKIGLRFDQHSQDSQYSTSPEGSHSMCFGTVEDCQRWLEERRRGTGEHAGERNGSPCAGSQEFTPPPQAGERRDMDGIKEPVREMCTCGHSNLIHRRGGSEKCYDGRCSCKQFKNAKFVYCHCASVGADGTTKCSPLPHRHKIRLPAATTAQARAQLSPACDNHLQVFLDNGWVEVAQMVCSMCTNNEPVPGDTLCAACVEEFGALDNHPTGDAQRLAGKEKLYCLNRDTMQGCFLFAAPGSEYCNYCQNYMQMSGSGMDNKAGGGSGKRNGSITFPRAMLITASARPCRLTPGCAGRMQASVRRYSTSLKPELFWGCTTCRVKDAPAKRTRAIADPRAGVAAMEAAEEAQLMSKLSAADEPELREPLNHDLGDMVEHIKDIGNEQ